MLKNLPSVMFTTSFLAITGCLSSSSSPEADELSWTTLFSQAPQVQWRSCILSSRALEIPYQVQRADLVQVQRRQTLIYQAAFRDSIKTIMQPLDPSLQPLGDGRVLGTPGEPFVVDFEYLQQAGGETWAHYRTKLKAGERYVAHVEYLPKNSSKISIINIPTDDDFSVQKIWFFPHSQSDASLVLRLNPSEADNSDNPLFAWFKINGIKNIVTKAGTFRAESEMASMNFFFAEEAREPMGTWVKKYEAERSSRPGSVQKRDAEKFRLVAKKIFSPQSTELVLGKSPSSISEVTLFNPAEKNTGVFIAWLKEASEESSQTQLEWGYYRFSAPDKISHAKTRKNKGSHPPKGKNTEPSYERFSFNSSEIKPIFKDIIKPQYEFGDLAFIPQEKTMGSAATVTLSWKAYASQTQKALVYKPISHLQGHQWAVSYNKTYGVYANSMQADIVGDTFAGWSSQKNMLILKEKGQSSSESNRVNKMRLCEF